MNQPNINTPTLNTTPPDKTWSSVIIPLILVIWVTNGWFQVKARNKAEENIAYAPNRAVFGGCR